MLKLLNDETKYYITCYIDVGHKNINLQVVLVIKGKRLNFV